MKDTIQAVQVQDNLRLNFLPKYFGKYFFKAEPQIYSTLSKLASEYHGGYWNFFELSNGGFYMAPESDKSFLVYVQSNGYADCLSPDAAGIVSCLFVINQLCWANPNDEKMIEQYYLLRDYASEHYEANAIFAAID